MKVTMLAATAILVSGMGQLPLSGPPMKMGLWEQTSVVNMKMTGAKVPPGMPTTQTMKSHACYTPETWSKVLGGSANKSCTFSNQSITGSHLSLDVTCAATGMKMHIDGEFTTLETGHGTVHVEMNSPGMNMLSDSKYETHFVSSSCGALAPGKSEIIP